MRRLAAAIVVLFAACRDIVGVTNHGGGQTMAVNHLELGWVSTSTSWIETYLAAS